ncbi:DNA polymerase III subunit gamma/tau [Kangiella sediminilitoris]|uniref:DNA polymerase III subunit gamma/tau n=1 Tax=Kangiella sediminilitoris TaxID=1144748 RepID=A0A1B3BB77_9GAMM|nr:DNA polymerase III subunit gamma/tau [Kangiella sediminilitoris]AOE50034.1 DNA polymerase III, subunits gamma and tau [Kangiella sediminilitoris]
MSYQVLARKWRPKNFQELRGQEHVSRALVNAIESGRLHHAYLFTGTRGVGKTTIARILSKCLNCETNGVTATPCGECGSCCEIDEGRFVDLIEVDAASRTKVDDTRELLENVQYRPTRGRYKVYLIDEVHMLSNSSFNALLKTLEEPPEHVIFLLATTDPQKLPVTVLSRCLQFHLKHMEEETIASHLQYILEQESIEFETSSLHLIAQSAEGSMRDALSLLDQAIAYGQGKVLEEDIRTMLGTIDHKFMVRLLEALANRDSVMAIKAIDDMSHYPVDFADALKELLTRLHQIAVYQATQVVTDSAATYVPEFAEAFESADLQMYYQLGLHARRDLEWAPTPKQGLEMALLRMLAFQLDSGQAQAKKKVSIRSDSADKSKSSDVGGTPKEQSRQASQELQSATQINDALPEGTASSNLESEEEAFRNTSKTSPGTDKKGDSDEGISDEFAGYEQFFQQEEEDREQDVSHSFDSATKQQPEYQQPPAEKHPRDEKNKQSEDDSEALASLHTALGLNLGQTSEAVPEQPSVKQGSEGASVLVEEHFGDNQKDTDTSDQEPAYDTDIERLMQAKDTHTDTVDKSVKTQQHAEVVPDNNELERVDALDAPEEALEWANMVKRLELEGTYHQIAQSSCAIWNSDKELVLEINLEQEILLTASAKDAIKQSLDSFVGRSISIDWQLKAPSIMTPAEIWQHQAKLRLQKACEDLNQHPFSKQLQQRFGAKIDSQSVTYLEN